MSSFPKNLRHLRKAAGMTQDNLAQKMNVTRQAISAWERGCTEPDIQTLVVLAQTLNVDANELLFGRRANYKATIQKADLKVVGISFGVSLIILILQLILYPYLLKLQSERLIQYAISYKQIVPPLGYYTGGVLLLSTISLFFNFQIKNKWRRIFLILSVALSIPSVLVILEELLWLTLPHFSAPFSGVIIRQGVLKPALITTLFKIFPFVSGMFMIAGKERNNKQENGGEKKKESA